MLMSSILLSPCAVAMDDTQGPPRPTKEQAAPQFPREIKIDSGTATIYQPQVEGHQGYESILLWSALRYQSNDGELDTVGAIKMEALMDANFDARTVTVYDRTILESYFPELSEDAAAALQSALQEAMRTDAAFPLDVLLTALASIDREAPSVEVKNTPPLIYYRESPAFLVRVDGDPVNQPLVENGDLLCVINASWDLFFDRAKETYYLLVGKSWLQSKSLKEGPWETVETLPEGFSALPDDDRFSAAREAIPATPFADGEIPEIIVTSETSELIVTDGTYLPEPIEGTSLAYIYNTSSDILYDLTEKEFYLLTSGRWFQASDLNGPWATAETLPADFQNIPADHDRAHVRSSIPDTIEARLAVAEAEVPRKAEVKRDLAAPEIQYQGEAQFEDIETTGVSRATNADKDVFIIDGHYYMCYNAVWFESETENGPWAVADSVPSEIYSIPSSSPAYHVTYVKIEDTTDTHVYCSYSAGYNHSYVSGGVVVYGSGYSWGLSYGYGYGNPYYHPYYGYYYPYNYWRRWGYPYYYPRTYGYASFYNPRLGTYGHGRYVYGPYGGAWAGNRYNPTTGRRGVGRGAWDYNTALYQGASYNPRNGIGTATRQGYQYYGDDAYARWGTSVARRGDQWVRTGRVANEDGSAFRYKTSGGGQGTRVTGDRGTGGVYRSGDGDLYAGRNGDVYRRNENGDWEKRSQGDWNPVDRPTATPAQRDQIQSRPSNVDRPTVTPEQRDRIQSRPSNIDRSQFDQNRQPRSTNNYHQLNRDAYNRNYGNQRYQSFQRSGGASMQRVRRR